MGINVFTSDGARVS